MDNYWEKNLRVISENEPSLYEELQIPTKKETDLEVGIELIEERKVLYVIKDTRTFQMDSLYDSEFYLKVFANGLDRERTTKYFIFGFGNGTYIRETLKKSNDDSLLYVYEPSKELLQLVFEQFDVSDVLSDKRVTIFLPDMEKNGLSYFDLVKKKSQIIDLYYGTMQNIELINYATIFPEQYVYFLKQTEDVVNNMAGERYATFVLAPKFLTNTIKNAEYFRISKDADDLKNRLPEDLTAFLVSRGPSLEKNVDELKKAKGHSIIFAVDAAIGILLNHGIVPDFYGCVDALKDKEHFDFPEVRNIPVIADFQAAHAAIKGHNNQMFFNMTDIYIRAFCEERKIKTLLFDRGGSVACLLFGFIMELGIKRIVFVGQDLAYTKDKFYAEGSYCGQSYDELTSNSMKVEGVMEKEVSTTTTFHLFRRWFEQKIAAHPEVTAINATEGGARIHGTKEMRLCDAIDQYCNLNIDVKKYVEQTADLFTAEQKEEFKTYMCEVPSKIELAKENLRQCYRTQKALYQMIMERKYMSTKYDNLSKKFNKLMAEAEDSGIYEYISSGIGKQITDYRLMETTEEELEKMEKREQLKVRSQEKIKLLELAMSGCDKALKEARPLLEKQQLKKGISIIN